MDPTRFDHLTRLLGRAGGRRAVLGALLGGLLGASAADAVAPKRGKRKDRDKDRGHDRNTPPGKKGDRDGGQTRDRLQAERRGKAGKRRKHKKKKRKRPGNNGGTAPNPPPADCCGTKSCAPPEPGSTRSECDFAGQSFAGQDLNGSTFRGIDGREATFTQTANHGSVFADACLQGARFRRARLDGSTWGDACLFDADFTGADFGGDLTLFENARFCGTTMPDGSLNDRDCGRATRCCQSSPDPGPSCQSAADCADQPCQTKACQNGTCVYDAVFSGPSPNDLCTFCCETQCCLSPANQCNTANACCVPNCERRVCGPDGCGGTGTCGPDCPITGGQRCDATGQCVCDAISCPDGCCDATKECWPGDKVVLCGKDGETCQTCGAGQGCVNQQCQACTPQCEGRQCGPDGCGGTCGVCDDLLCDEQTGQCFCAAPVCSTGCCSNGPGNPGVCRDPQADLCGTNGQQCVSCPPPGVCTAQGQCVCTPDCAGKTCGSDGCGGSCGSCPPGEICGDPIPGQCTCSADSCPTGLQCCPAGGNDRCLGVDGAPCAQAGDCCSGACCGGVCCSENQTCCGETCCGPGRACCGTICCPNGQHCCGGACCPSNRQCCDHGVCCDDDSECRGGVCTECEPDCTCFGQDGCNPDAGLNQFCGAGGAGNPCFCVVSRTGQPLCAGTVVDSPTCTTDADCQGFGAGSVCVNAAPAGSECPTWGNFCVIPCARPGATSAPFRARAKEEAHAPAVTTPEANASLSARASGRAAVHRAIVRPPDAGTAVAKG